MNSPDDTSVLVELAERCANATQPHRAIDYDIAHYVTRAHMENGKAPAYTASIDAALTLLPSGWAVSFGEKPGLPPHLRMFAWFNDHNTPDGIAKRHTEGSARTIALALCAAALRARAAKDQS